MSLKLRSYNTVKDMFRKNIHIQSVLYILAFLIFGLGDAISAVLLMNTYGIIAEYNIIAQDLYMSTGPVGFVIAKVISTLVFLGLIILFEMKHHKRSYWMINGFLTALILGGILAIQANLKAIAGVPHMNSTTILIIYIIFAVIAIEIGDNIDLIVNETRT